MIYIPKWFKYGVRGIKIENNYISIYFYSRLLSYESSYLSYILHSMLDDMKEYTIYLSTGFKINPLK